MILNESTHQIKFLPITNRACVIYLYQVIQTTYRSVVISFFAAVSSATHCLELQSRDEFIKRYLIMIRGIVDARVKIHDWWYTPMTTRQLEAKRSKEILFGISEHVKATNAMLASCGTEIYMVNMIALDLDYTHRYHRQ